MSSKYKEFWINEDKFNDTLGLEYVAKSHETRRFVGIHVIEYAAYNQAVYELDKSRSDHQKKYLELKGKLDKLVGATKKMKCEFFESHFSDCSTIDAYDDENVVCDCGNAGILEAVESALSEIEREV